MAKWRVAGINFDHFHMGDNPRMAHEHPDAEIVGLCDEQPQRMHEAVRRSRLAWSGSPCYAALKGLRLGPCVICSFSRSERNSHLAIP